MGVEMVRIRIQCAAKARKAYLYGREHLVLPAVILQAQVLNNNLGATFLPEREVTEEWAQEWNNIPVLVGEHPTINGIPVSGRDPAILEARGVGSLQRVHAETVNGTRRLKAEVWLDVSRAQEVEGFQAVLDRLAAGKPVELSTGFNTQLDEAPGVHNGVNYDLVLHPQGADHLVISATMTGACSVSDGCGLGVNKNKDGTTVEPTLTSATPPLETLSADNMVALLNEAAERLKKKAGNADPATPADKQSPIVRLWEKVASLIGLATGPSDEERRVMVRDALQKKFGGMERHVLVVDTYGESKEVVYWIDTPTGPDPSGLNEYYRVTFEEGEGQVTLSDPVKVRRLTEYKPVAGNTKEVGAVEQNKQTTDGGDGKPQATNAGDGTQKPTGDGQPAGQATNTTQQKPEGQGAAPEPSKPDVSAVLEAVNKLTTLVEKQGETVKAQGEQLAAMSQITKPAIEERERLRQSLVKELAANQRCAFEEAELEGKPVEELQKLQAMARGENYALRSGAGVVNAQAPAYMPVKPYYEKTEAKKE